MGYVAYSIYLRGTIWFQVTSAGENQKLCGKVAILPNPAPKEK